MHIFEVALLASAAGAGRSDGPLPRRALDLLLDPQTKALLKDCSPGVLTAVVRGLGVLPEDAGCGGLLRSAAGELLERRPLRAPHAACLVALLGREVAPGVQVVRTAPVLSAAAEALGGAQGGELPVQDAVAALEGLVRTRAAALSTAEEELVAEAARALARRLHGGSGAARAVAAASGHPRDRGLALRLLAALWALPEACGGGALASLAGVRWPSGLPSGLSEETVAAAACALARSGAWAGARCGYLLAQAPYWYYYRHIYLSPSLSLSYIYIYIYVMHI